MRRGIHTVASNRATECEPRLVSSTRKIPAALAVFFRCSSCSGLDSKQLLNTSSAHCRLGQTSTKDRGTPQQTRGSLQTNKSQHSNTQPSSNQYLGRHACTLSPERPLHNTNFLQAQQQVVVCTSLVLYLPNKDSKLQQHKQHPQPPLSLFFVIDLPQRAPPHANSGRLEHKRSSKRVDTQPTSLSSPRPFYPMDGCISACQSPHIPAHRNKLPPINPSPPTIPSTLLFSALTTLLSSATSSASTAAAPPPVRALLAGTAGAICTRHSSARTSNSLTHPPITPSPAPPPPPNPPIAPAARLSTSLTHASTAAAIHCTTTFLLRPVNGASCASITPSSTCTTSACGTPSPTNSRTGQHGSAPTEASCPVLTAYRHTSGSSASTGNTMLSSEVRCAMSWICWETDS